MNVTYIIITRLYLQKFIYFGGAEKTVDVIMNDNDEKRYCDMECG